MKKILTTAVIALGISLCATAQPKAVGGRFGVGPIEASYEHYFKGPNFFEFELGLDVLTLSDNSFGFQASALYNFVVMQPDWTDRGDWEIYAGPGLTLGYLKDKVTYEDKTLGKCQFYDMGFMAGICFQAGLSYTFWFPLQISVDLRPTLGLHINNGYDDAITGERILNKVGFYDKGVTWGWIPTLSIRYAF